MAGRDEKAASTYLRQAEALWAAGQRLPAAAAYVKAESYAPGTVSAFHCSTAAAIAAFHHLSPPFTAVLLLRLQPFILFRRLSP